MTKIKQNTIDSPTQPNFEMGFKEILFACSIYTWAAPVYILGAILSSKKKNGGLINTLLVLVALFSLVILFLGINESILKLITCILIAVLLVFLDCNRNKFFENSTIHFCNSIFLGFSFYFVAIDLHPELFAEQIQNVMQKVGTSLPIAFNMLVLCLIFQNIGYYLVWSLLNNSSNKWFTSHKNLVNLSFIHSHKHQINLFALLMGLGLTYRVASIASGRFFYVNASADDNSGVDFSIASLLSQFEPLYKVAWFYGLALLFGRDRDSTVNLRNTYSSANNIIIKASLFFLVLELFFQLISGSKGRFLSAVLVPIATVFFFTHRHISNRALIITLCTITFSWLLIYPTLIIYRGILVSTVLGGNVTFVDFLKIAWDTFQSLSWEEYQILISTPFNSAGNAESVSALTSIVYSQSDLSQNIQDAPLVLLQRLLFFWVPRFLWSDKPQNISGNLIGRLSGRLGEGDYGTSVIITAPGELFIYCGLLGSILMILSGVVIRWFNEAISPFKDFTAFRLAVYFSYLPSVITIVGSAFEGPLTGIILQMFTLYSTLYLVRFLG